MKKQLKEGGVALGSEFKSLPRVELVVAEIRYQVTLYPQSGWKVRRDNADTLLDFLSVVWHLSPGCGVNHIYGGSSLSQTRPEIHLCSDSGSC